MIAWRDCRWLLFQFSTVCSHLNLSEFCSYDSIFDGSCSFCYLHIWFCHSKRFLLRPSAGGRLCLVQWVASNGCRDCFLWNVYFRVGQFECSLQPDIWKGDIPLFRNLFVTCPVAPQLFLTSLSFSYLLTLLPFLFDGSLIFTSCLDWFRRDHHSIWSFFSFWILTLKLVYSP